MSASEFSPVIPNAESQEPIRTPAQFQLHPCDLSTFMYSYLPTGCEFVLNTPFELKSREHVQFVFRPTPRFFHPLEISKMQFQNKGNETNKVIVANHLNARAMSVINPYSKSDMSISQTAFNTIKGLKPNHFVRWVSQCSFLSKLSLGYLGFRGSLKFRLRAITGSITHGIIEVFPLREIPTAKMNIDPLTETYPWTRNVTINDGRMETYLTGDLSSEKHFEFTVPYSLPLPYYKWKDFEDFEETLVRAWPAETWIGIAFRSPVYSANTSRVIFALDIAAGPDFEFVYPIPIREEACLSANFDISKIMKDNVIQNQEFAMSVIDCPYPDSDGALFFSKTGFIDDVPGNRPNARELKPRTMEDEVKEYVEKLNLEGKPSYDVTGRTLAHYKMCCQSIVDE